MIEHRPDWCISRQRVWGVPIVAFHCQVCGEVLLDSEIVFHVADIFEKEGADAWFSRSADELLPAGVVCKGCGKRDFKQDNAILDVWFDSGVSYACVCEERDYLGAPVQMYLEGTDQHRGWFHSSLLCAVGTRGWAPYQTVLTHGYTVDSHGKKYSKSSGNYIPMEDLLKDYGAEILRMWTASENFRNDVRVSREILDGISQVYRKVRNTLRYMLSNLADFGPSQDALPVAELLPLDRWMLGRVENFKRRALPAYEKWEFHHIYHGLNQLCTVDLSALYFDLVRDRLYCELPGSKERRSAQTALWLALDAITRLMAPVLAYTAEEVHDHLPGRDPAAASVHCLDLPVVEEGWLDEGTEKLFDEILKHQMVINQDIDRLQKNKTIGHPNDAQIVIAENDANYQFFTGTEERLKRSGGEDLARLFRVSKLNFVDRVPKDVEIEKALEAEGDSIIVSDTLLIKRADGTKCPRCWFHRTDIGKDPDHPELCGRCTDVVNELERRGLVEFPEGK
jgi:isoleucyl-tRNA synthetase